MAYIHLIFGLLLFVIFTITGHFMRVDFPDKSLISPELRILMRSRHLYILLSALIHVVLGLYLTIQAPVWRKTFQLFGSFLLFAGSILLLSAFIYESYYTQHFSDLSRYGLYTTFAGVIAHFIGKVWTKTNNLQQ